LNLLVAALAGGLFGAGLLLAIRGVRVHPAPLGELFADLHHPRTPSAARRTTWWQRAGALIGGVGLAGRDGDLAVCERSRAKFVGDRATWAALGAAAGSALLILRPVGVFTFVPTAAAWAAIPAGAVAGWFYALADLRSDAARHRRDFVHSLAAYLELTSILMAGGAGVETALHEAAAIGSSPGFRHLRASLSAAAIRREPPWSAFGELGRRIGVRELERLEAAMTLAGSGARVKESLRVRAEGLRERDLAAQEAAAHARSETMVLPVAMMFAGFVLLLGYPAIAGLS
jgi:Flp pilus assembly protein TadB